MKRLTFAPILILSCICFFSGKEILAQGASGLHNPIFGASALSQGNAFTARADDASAIYFNPAGLTQLQKPQLSLGANFVLPFVEYHNNGDSEDMDTKINTIPDMYFTSPIIQDKLAAGIGINVPYGLQGKWDGDGFSKYVVTDFNLRIININPTITYKPFSFFSVGAGLDYYYASADQGKHINVGLINSLLTGTSIDADTPDGLQDHEMRGDAFGYNTGALFNITPNHSVGISFRSKADIDFNGKLQFSDLSGATAAVFGSDNFDTRTSTTATIPEMLSIGYAYKHNNLWSVEADVQWTNWSRFDIIKYDFKTTNALLETNKEDVRNWNNTLSFALGGEYKLNEALKVRGGYTFHESPIPGETFEPSMPQSSRHALFSGFGYNWGKNLNKGIDFAFGTIFYENRNVDNSVGDASQGPIDGHYDLITHIMAINFNYVF